MKNKCCAKVRSPGMCFHFHYHQCQRIGKVVREGNWYCRQHDPVEIRNRKEARADRHKSKEEEDQAILKEAKRLASLLGCGKPYYYAGFRTNDSGYQKFLLMSFEDVKRIIAEKG